MKEFCNLIEICLLQDVLSFREDMITLKPGRSSIVLSTDDFTLTPKEETGESGREHHY